MKQTALEFLVSHLIEYGFDLSLHKIEIEQAKEMEKQQRSYSEEDMTEYAMFVLLNKLITPKEWFEKIKNK